MRILQIVTLITPDGAFGGPVRVATNQTRALARLGHDVTLVAGASGFGRELPTSFDGVPVTLFPARRLTPGLGFAATFSPSMLSWLRNHASSFDIAHIHLARDLVTLPVAAMVRRFGIPYVLQTHGMVDPSESILARVVDPLLTVPALTHAAAVLSLTPEEDAGVRAVGGDLPVVRVLNGVDPAVIPTDEPGPERGALDILFLARLHGRKRPALFAEVAGRVLADTEGVQFEVVGPDGGEAAAVDAEIARIGSSALTRSGAIAPEQVERRMASCDLYVLPSIDEPFPMSVIEALSLGKPVIVTDTCGLADLIAEADAGLVIGPSAEELERALRELISNEARREELGRNAARLVRNRLSLVSVAERLDGIYSGLI